MLPLIMMIIIIGVGLLWESLMDLFFVALSFFSCDFWCCNSKKRTRKGIPSVFYLYWTMKCCNKHQEEYVEQRDTDRNGEREREKGKLNILDEYKCCLTLYSPLCLILFVLVFYHYNDATDNKKKMRNFFSCHFFCP